MKEFIVEYAWVAGWLALVVLVYVAAYLDYVWFRDNIKDKMLKAYDALTEED